MVSVTKNKEERKIWDRRLGEKFVANCESVSDPRICKEHSPPTNESSKSRKRPYSDGRRHIAMVSEECEELVECDDDIIFEDDEGVDHMEDPDVSFDEDDDTTFHGSIVNLLVTWQLILPSLSKCWKCLKEQKDTNVKPKVKRQGVAVKAFFDCLECGNSWDWCSSDVLDRRGKPGCKQKELNLRMAASIISTANGFSRIYAFFKMLEIPFFSKQRFHQLINDSIKPAIEKAFDLQRQKVLSKIQEVARNLGGVNLCGDGQFDSRGYSAYICRFSLMDISTNFILDHEVCRKERAGSSILLEKIGHEKSFPRLLDELKTLTGLPNPILSFTSDRCVNIASTMKNYPTIEHHYDSWHWIRSVRRDIDEKYKQKQFAPMRVWVKPFLNHVHKAISAAEGNGKLAWEIIMSFFMHVQNIHSDFDAVEDVMFEVFNECMHDVNYLPNPTRPFLDLTKPEDKTAFYVLYNIMAKPNRERDIQSVAPFFATSALESFHGLAASYLPKEHFFDKSGYELRSKIAVIHWNSLQFEEINGSRTVECKVNYFCKSKKTVVQKSRKTVSNHQWRFDILNIAKENIISGNSDSVSDEQDEIDSRAQTEATMYSILDD